jgi:hypothetical protein
VDPSSDINAADPNATPAGAPDWLQLALPIAGTIAGAARPWVGRAFGTGVYGLQAAQAIDQQMRMKQALDIQRQKQVQANQNFGALVDSYAKPPTPPAIGERPANYESDESMTPEDRARIRDFVNEHGLPNPSQAQISPVAATYLKSLFAVNPNEGIAQLTAMAKKDLSPTLSDLNAFNPRRGLTISGATKEGATYKLEGAPAVFKTAEEASVSPAASPEEKTSAANYEMLKGLTGPLRILADTSSTPTQRAQAETVLAQTTEKTPFSFLTDPSLGLTPQQKLGYVMKIVSAQHPNINILSPDERRNAFEQTAQALANGDLTRLKDVTSMRSDQRMALYARAKQLNPAFNTANVDRQIKTMDQFSTGKQADSLQSLGTFLEHAGELKDVADKVALSTPPLLNRPINWFKQNAAGSPEYQQLLTAMEPVGKEFESFLLNNRALYETDRKQIETLINPNSSLRQVTAALQQMGKTVNARYNEMNGRFRKVMGKNISDTFPENFTPEATAAASKIGISLAGQDTTPSGPAAAGGKPPLSAFER